jgi:hypothetical protein
MRSKVHEFTGTLLDYTRTQKELEVVLNHNPEEGWDPKNKYALDRLKLAIKYKQKSVRVLLSEKRNKCKFLFNSSLHIPTCSSYSRPFGMTDSLDSNASGNLAS